MCGISFRSIIYRKISLSRSLVTSSTTRFACQETKVELKLLSFARLVCFRRSLTHMWRGGLIPMVGTDRPFGGEIFWERGEPTRFYSQVSRGTTADIRKGPHDEARHTTVVRPSVSRTGTGFSRYTGERAMLPKHYLKPFLSPFRRHVLVSHIFTSFLSQAMEVLEGILSGGRTSRMFRSLVVEKQIALQASFSTEFPGNKYPNLGLVFALPSQGTSLDDLAKAVQEELEKVKQPGSITQSELDRVKVHRPL